VVVEVNLQERADHSMSWSEAPTVPAPPSVSAPAQFAADGTSPLTLPAWWMKHAFDVTVAVLGLLVLLPLLLAVAAGVKLTSRGPVLFRQRRIGLGGAAFTMYKFRTFPLDHVDDKFSRDHRECPLRFGRFLRRTSIDELPQLVNVLRGDMSLVGPRPERPGFAASLSKTVAGYDRRHRVPGGITGAAQVRGFWGNTSVDERVRLDNEYIDGWSFWGDLGILLRTIPATVRKGRSAGTLEKPKGQPQAQARMSPCQGREEE
jgi:lipopolysaccharide/colanic/teichoic acid biosynthesis glycosyltransferase